MLRPRLMKKTEARNKKREKAPMVHGLLENPGDLRGGGSLVHLLSSQLQHLLLLHRDQKVSALQDALRYPLLQLVQHFLVFTGRIFSTTCLLEGYCDTDIMFILSPILDLSEINVGGGANYFTFYSQNKRIAIFSFSSLNWRNVFKISLSPLKA